MSTTPARARTVNICRYKVKPGKETEMVALLAKHHPALHAAGLVGEDKPVIYRGLPSGKPNDDHGAERVFIEIFSWINDDAPKLAHQSPQVMAVWEPMGAICEEMDFPNYAVLDL